MCAPTFLYASHAGPMGLAEPRTVISSLSWKRVLRKAHGLRRYAVLACATLLVCLVPASAPAQQQTAGPVVSASSLLEESLGKTSATEGSGSVAGTVLDLSGASVPGADVTLMHRDGTLLQAMVSETNGEFNFTKILPGSYLVTVDAQGFALFTSAEFAITVKQAYEMPNISLSLAATNIEVMVRPTDVIAAEE